MAKYIKQYRVLVASPSDVMNERRVIRQVIHNWNTSIGATMNVTLEPVMWETHAVPEMGDRPQAIINRQIAEDCDVLIGAFWTRLGSPTGVAISGTAEEINLFILSQKPALVYFSAVKINPDDIDIEQYQRLRQFKKELRSQGLLGEFSNLEELKDKVSADLTHTISRLNKLDDVNQATVSKAPFDVEAADQKVADSEKDDTKIPYDELSEKDRRYWLNGAMRFLMGEGVSSINSTALNNVAQGLYYEALRTTEDLRQEFLAAQRADMRHNKSSDAQRKAASRLPKDGHK